MTKKRINTATAQNPEVMPAERDNSQKGKNERSDEKNPLTALARRLSHSEFGQGDRAAVLINAEYEAWKLADGDANVSLLRVGIALEAVKAVMPQGEFGPWMESHCRVSKSHVYRFRGVARKFLSTQKLLLPAAVDLSRANGDTSGADKFEKLAKQFIAGRSQSELFDACKPPREEVGGDHGGGKARAEKLARDCAEQDVLQANEQWDKIVDLFREFVRLKRYVHVKPTMLDVGLKSIRDVEDPLRAYVKEELS